MYVTTETKIFINQNLYQIQKKGILFGFDKKKYSYIIMNIENKKINYINDIELIEEEPKKI